MHNVCIYYISYYLTMIIHESGHYFFSRLFNFEVTIHLGDSKNGKRNKLLSIGPVTIYRSFLIIGYCRYEEKPKNMTKLKNILICAGGILFNLITISVFIIVYLNCINKTVKNISGILIFTNFVFVVSNSIPIYSPIIKLDTDGLKIYKILKSK